jgi:hypothetical protein
MAGADQHGVNVLIHLQVFFVESYLPVGALRFPAPARDAGRSERRSAKTCAMR